MPSCAHDLECRARRVKHNFAGLVLPVVFGTARFYVASVSLQRASGDPSARSCPLVLRVGPAGGSCAKPETRLTKPGRNRTRDHGARAKPQG
jgi:hypothetical protein